MTKTRRIQLAIAFALAFIALGSYTLLAWEPVPVESDPLVRPALGDRSLCWLPDGRLVYTRQHKYDE